MRVDDAPPFLVAEWHEADRVLELAYEESTALRDEMADVTIRWLDAFCAVHGRDLGLLVDATHVRDATYGYRQRFGAWFRERAPEVRMAIFGMSPFVRVMVLLFAKATGLTVRIARDREEAMRWLRPLPAR